MNKIFADRIKLLSAIRIASGQMKEKFTDHKTNGIDDALVAIRANTNEFLSISQEDRGAVAYASKKEYVLDSERRTKTTLGRYIRRRIGIGKEAIPDNTLDMLSSIVKKIIVEKELDKHITVVKGKDILWHYRNAKATSCMTGCECEKVELYSLNPNKVSLVLHEKARALLWTTDEGPIVLDRVYPAQCHSVNIIRSWAESKGYLVRSNPDRVVETGYIPEISSGQTLTVTLKHRNIFPYMDTFVYGKFGKNEIVAKNDPKFGNMIMHTTHGNYDRAKVCSRCECRVNNGDFTTGSDGNLYCYDCFDTMFFCCDCCGEHKIVENDGRHILPSSYCLCEGCFAKTDICKSCGVHEYHSHMALVGDDYYCFECYVEKLLKCNKCNNRLPKEMFIIDEVCKNCFEYEKCGSCGDKITDIKANVFMENGNIICNNCGNE